MRRSLLKLNGRHLPKALRQALVLITLLLLPSAAWGVEVTKTITFNKGTDGTPTTISQNSTGTIIPVSINETWGSNSYDYDSNVTIDDYGALTSYSYSSNNAIFTIDEQAKTDNEWFIINIPGNYPKKPTEVKLFISYANAIKADNGQDNYSAIIEVGGEGATKYTDTNNGNNYLENGLSFYGNPESGQPGTERSEEGDLKIFIYLDGDDENSPTFTIEKVEMTYETEDYNLSVSGIPVTGVNVNNILGDGKVSYDSGTKTLTLNNATINGYIELSSQDLYNITFNLIGSNTFNIDTYIFDASEENVYLTLTGTGELTFNNINSSHGYHTYINNTISNEWVSNGVYNGWTCTRDNTANTLAIRKSDEVPHWPDAATNDNGAIKVETVDNEPWLTMNYAATTSYSFPLTVLSGSTVAYSSTVPSVATVNATTGDVTILKAGITKITARVNNTTDYNYNLTISKGEGIIYMMNNLKIVYGGATAIPDDLATTTPTVDAVTNQAIPLEYTWTAATDGFATVDETAKTITPSKLGAWGNQISVKFHDDANYIEITDVTHTCSLTVVPPAPVIAEVERAYTIEGDTTFIIDDSKTVTIQAPTIPAEALETDNTINTMKLLYKIDNGADTEYPEGGININSSCILISWVEVRSSTNALVVRSENAYAKYVFREVPTLSLSYTEEKTLKMGETLAAPELGDFRPTVTWSSNNEEITSVNESTGVVTPVRPCRENETVTITATFAGDATYQSATATYNLKVTKGSGYLAIIEGDRQLESTTIEAVLGQALDLKEALTLEYPSELELTWACKNFTSYDDGINDEGTIATITNDGVVTPTGFCRAEVTITTVGNDYYENDDVTVLLNIIPPTPTIETDKDEGLYYPDDVTITATQASSLQSDNTINTHIDDNNYSQENPYTINFTGLHSITIYTQIERSQTGTVSATYNQKSEIISKKYIITNKPVITAKYEDGSDYNGEKTGYVECSINVEEPVEGCTLMYYKGTDKSKAVEYNNESIILEETTTLNVFVRYTNSDAEETFDSEPITQTFKVSYSLEEEEEELTFDEGIYFRTCYLRFYSLKVPTGLKAYIITDVSKNSVVATSIEYIPKEVPVLLEKKGEMPEGGYVAETYTGEKGDFSTNKLYYTEYGVNTSGKEYILFNNEFVKATGLIESNHCYLSLDGPGEESIPYTRGFSIDTSGNGTTDINSASLNNNKEMMTNQWYDLQGRRIQKPTKAGLYIVNGKKMVVNNK